MNGKSLPIQPSAVAKSSSTTSEPRITFSGTVASKESADAGHHQHPVAPALLGSGDVDLGEHLGLRVVGQRLGGRDAQHRVGRVAVEQELHRGPCPDDACSV